jgi:tRNA (uracil-5-)-methyltransferase
MIPVNDAPVNALFVESNGNAESSTSRRQVPPAVKGQVGGKKKNRRMKRHIPEPYSPADVTYRDVRDFLGEGYVDSVLAKGDESEWAAPTELELWSIHELTVGAFTVSGEPPHQSRWLSSFRLTA